MAEDLGWQVATFALERISPDEKSGAGSGAIWESYCSWCDARKAVPLAFAVFHAEFDKVAEAVGILRRQVGAHVLYDGIKLEAGGAT